ncbi:MAG TPA: biopolymer transporter ExbD [Polyangiales bacterium]|nr:biopolymer transporter ExbD [Polyangiales bacterium]
MPNLSPTQRAYIRRRSKVHELDPSELAGELNIIPFLDIVVNLIMFLLATTEAVLAIVQIEAQLPQLSSGGKSNSANKDQGLNLNVTITDSGVIVTGSGGKLAPGCEETTAGRVITVPKKGADYDWTALTECAVKIKAQYRDERDVIVGADPMIQYEHVVAAMDSLRGDAKAKKELFPKVLLSAGVR